MTFKNAFKTSVILLTTIISLNKASAQDTARADQPTAIKSLNKISLNLFGITAEREQKVGKIMALYGGLGIFGTYVYGTAIHYNSETNQVTFKKYDDFKFYPLVYGGVKHYYNIKQRIKKGKKTSNNAANYVGLDVMGVFPNLLDDDTLLSSQLNISPRWGLQRRLGNKGTFEFGIGPAMALAQGNTYFGATGKIAFSLLL